MILWNCVILALDRPGAEGSVVPEYFDSIFLIIYTVEMMLKIFGLGFVMKRNSYLRDSWNVLDFIIVVTAYIPLLVSSQSVDLTALRSFRVLRPLKTISRIKELKVIIQSLVRALPLLRDTIFILVFLFMVFAIAGLQLFSGLLKRRCFDPITGRPWTDEIGVEIICGSQSCPKGFVCGKMLNNPNYNITHFDTIFYAFLMVFQSVTLEGWTEIMIYLEKAFTPIVSLYFVGLIFIGTFFLLNLTLAVIKTVFTNSNKGKADDLTYDERLNLKIEHNKDKIVKLMRSYWKGELDHSRCQIYNDHIATIDAKTLKAQRREKALRNHSLARKSVANFLTSIKTMGRKAIGRQSTLHALTQKSSPRKVLEYTPEPQHVEDDDDYDDKRNNAIGHNPDSRPGSRSHVSSKTKLTSNRRVFPEFPGQLMQPEATLNIRPTPQSTAYHPHSGTSVGRTKPHSPTSGIYSSHAATPHPREGQKHHSHHHSHPRGHHHHHSRHDKGHSSQNYEPSLVEPTHPEGNRRLSGEFSSPNNSHRQLLSPKDQRPSIMSLATTVASPRIDLKPEKIITPLVSIHESNSNYQDKSQEYMSSVKEESMEHSLAVTNIDRTSGNATSSRQNLDSKSRENTKRGRPTATRGKSAFKKSASSKKAAPIRPTFKDKFLSTITALRSNSAHINTHLAHTNLPLATIAGISNSRVPVAFDYKSNVVLEDDEDLFEEINKAQTPGVRPKVTVRKPEPSIPLLMKRGLRITPTVTSALRPGKSKSHDTRTKPRSRKSLTRKIGSRASAGSKKAFNDSDSDSFRLSSDGDNSLVLHSRDEYGTSTAELMSVGLLNDSDFISINDMDQYRKIQASARKGSRRASSKRMLTHTHLEPKEELEVAGLMSNNIRGVRSALRPRLNTFKAADMESTLRDDRGDGDIFVIDLRHIKTVPNFTRKYQSSALDDVLPSLQQTKLVQLEKDEWRTIHETKLHMIYHVKKRDFNKDDPNKGTAEMASSIPIRKRSTLGSVAYTSGQMPSSFNQFGFRSNTAFSGQKTLTSSKTMLRKKSTARDDMARSRGLDSDLASPNLRKGTTIEMDGGTDAANRRKTYAAAGIKLMEGDLETEKGINYPEMREVFAEQFEEQDAETIAKKESELNFQDLYLAQRVPSSAISLPCTYTFPYYRKESSRRERSLSTASPEVRSSAI